MASHPPEQFAARRSPPGRTAHDTPRTRQTRDPTADGFAGASAGRAVREAPQVTVGASTPRHGVVSRSRVHGHAAAPITAAGPRGENLHQRREQTR